MLHCCIVVLLHCCIDLHRTPQDLINCTPTGHPDYDPLQKTLIIARQFLESVDEKSDDETSVSIGQNYGCHLLDLSHFEKI
jgi:hypothetical protein